MTNAKIAQKLHNALNEAKNIADSTKEYGFARAFGYLESAIEWIIEELEEDD